MIERVIEFSIRNRFVVLVATAIVVVWGVWSVLHTPIDAIPDLSENQVIVFTDWMGRSPREIEDQITYPLSVNLQGLAGVKAVRSSSEFNFSMINIIFEDHVDFYFARQRVLERLALAGTFLPPDVVPYLAPDATALGQIFWYTVEGGGLDPGRLRAVQDWYVRYQLNSVPGVAQVASVGGSPIEYQIDVDPVKLRAYGITLGELYAAVARSNSAVGGRVIQKGNAEYLVRGVGWITSPADIESIVVRTDSGSGTPVYVSNVASVGLGPQFRRSVLEKDGNEAVGGVVMMRHGENPLDVTRRIKAKIVQLQPGLPVGVRIVPFYDRTRLIEGAIGTLTEILTHEMIIASLAVLLVLMHVRSAFVICLTLPLAVLVSFILMRLFGISSNIMSLAGIAISIGVLVDQAIVMVENATHHLTAHFGTRKVEGDIRELVLPACRTVGRPIFFSVLIILVSFIPVFALSGLDAKTFHPLAFTKSFAMLGVAVISVTLVPALIPTFIKGRLRREEENWLVRSLINIYKPVLTWAMDYPKVVNWFFVVLLALGIHLSRQLGQEYMPPLDEGSILDMPVTVPRASITQVADDLKVRDGVLRQFPEVEQVVGKAGRAETPTDPAPLDMVETVVNLRPRELWPKRKLQYEDAERQTQAALSALIAAGLVRVPESSEASSIVSPVTMNSLARLDKTLREFILARGIEHHQELATELTRAFVDKLVDHWRRSGSLLRPVTEQEAAEVSAALAVDFGPLLADGPAQEDVNRLLGKAVEQFAARGSVETKPELLALRPGSIDQALWSAGEALGVDRPTLFTQQLDFVRQHRHEALERWTARTDDDIFNLAVAAYNWHALQELRAAARDDGWWQGSPLGTDGGAGGMDQRSLPVSESVVDAELVPLRAALDPPFARRLFLWQKTKADLVQEMDTALQMPGWGNIWTQPIINRIDMLATGVRTMIGVKVFGRDLDEIQRVSEQVAAVLRRVRGAVDVFPDQNVGKGYLEIAIDRKRAARYGINVGDIQDVIEVALGGKTVTTTVEGRERFPVRIRYARALREDEEDVKNLLVSAGSGMSRRADDGMTDEMSIPSASTADTSPLQVPLSMVADVRIVEGPAMIKSENGLLRSYVQLNVRDRDIVGFVDEAQRAVAQNVTLPAGMYLEWSGQFEHQLRSRKTLQIVFPAVILLIFVILYLTYHDFMDAVLMMMAVPEALVGGVFFLWLFNFNFSVAVWVGFIACFGMATETGIIMLVYLREAIERKGGLEKIASLAELRQTVIEGAVHRLRPKLLTEGVAIVALAPMLWSAGVGHEVISAMAAPVLGGLLVSDEVVDIFIPVRFYWVRRRRWLKLHGQVESR
jgi:copper/silver efflux system protein